MKLSFPLPNCMHLAAITQPWEVDLSGADLARLARAADDLGFHAIHVPEHFVIPVEHINDVCGEIVSIFDALIPYQYSEQDRRAGYFFGKDRRGQLHRVPLMTVSIGVVTNERRHFTLASQVSELATEMKSYAKTLTGSVFSIDRRQDAGSTEAEAIVPVSHPARVGEAK